MQQGKKDFLDDFRKQVQSAIEENYQSTEKFCFENSIDKSVMSRFLGRKQRHFSTGSLIKITSALGKKLEIRMK